MVEPKGEPQPAATPAPPPPKVSRAQKLVAAGVGILGGILLVVQGGVNSSLRREAVSNPVVVACISFTIGLFAVGTVAVLHNPQCRDIPVRDAPWQAFMGGVLGPMYVTTAILLVDQIGFAAFQLSATTGQLTSSMICDARGFLGIRKRKPTLLRVVAVATLVAGVVLCIDLSGVDLEWWQMVLYCCIACLAGGVFPVQGCVNALLTKFVGTPFRAATVSFGVGATILLCIALISSAITGFDGFGGSEFWMWSGGFCGAVLVTANVYGIPRLGAAAFTTVFIAAQLLTALVLDSVGAFGVDKVTPGAQRLAGVLLAVAAAGAYQIDQTKLCGKRKRAVVAAADEIPEGRMSLESMVNTRKAEDIEQPDAGNGTAAACDTPAPRNPGEDLPGAGAEVARNETDTSVPKAVAPALPTDTSVPNAAAPALLPAANGGTPLGQC
eukprot:TRINITY_DN8447_c0_g1_i1.p1 TRINITY_DN8447_c0_g1~~TRINITY_DN8447_c0_g1_i1.p1  ORF type:complete len:440 (+),score=23.81 TRINITY_DN8447_c0_g1_i1:61-1380(+)